MTPTRRAKLERLIRDLRDCPPPKRVDLHERAALAMEEWLREDEGRQQTIPGTLRSKTTNGPAFDTGGA